MKISSRMSAVVSPVLVAILTSGCLLGSQTFVAGHQSVGIRVELSIGDTQAFFEEGTNVRLVVEVGSARDDRFQAGVGLPPGVELVSGDLQHEGPIEADGSVTLGGVVRAEAPGSYTLHGWAGTLFCISPPVIAVAVSLSGDTSNAQLREVPPPEGALQVVADADEEDSASVAITVDSPFTTEALVCIETPPNPDNGETLQIVEGTREWGGTLQPGENTPLEVRVDAPEDGRYPFIAWLYPDPSLTPQPPTDEIALERRNGTWDVISPAQLGS